MKCRIFRDFDTDKVVSVLNEQGQESSLYREALAATNNEEQALDIWSVTTLDSFKNYIQPGREANLEETMLFINNMNTTDTFSLQEVVELSNNLQSVNTESPDTLLNTLQRTFFNGKGMFEVRREKMRASGLYTDSEINNILSFPSIRAQVKQFINKLRNTLKEDNTLSTLFIDNSSNKEFNVQDSSEHVGMGKFQNYLPEEVRDYVIKNLRNFTTDTDLLTKIQALDNSDIRDYILDSPEVLESTKELLKNSKILPVFTEMNGDLIPKMENDLVPSIMSTMKVGEPTESFTQAMDVIRGIPSEVWYKNEGIIKPLLTSVELEAAKYHIDISGLSETFNEKSKEEVVGILDVIDDFLFSAEQDVISNVEIYNLGQDLNEYFGVEPSQIEEVITVSETDKGRNLVRLNTTLPEIDAFKVGGFIKLRDNVYQRAAVNDSFNSMLEETYEGLMRDVTILPNALLEKINLRKNGVYNFSYLNNEKNKEKIIRSLYENISRDADMNLGFTINDKESFDWARQVTLYKELLNIPVRAEENLGIEDFKSRKDFVSQGGAAIDYLTSDFISDFYSEVLTQKVLDTPLYNSTLKYFEVSDNGITFNSNNPMIQAQVLQTMESVAITPLLKLYSAISKDPSMQFLVPTTVGEGVLDIQDRRDHIVNNTNVLPNFSKSHTKVDQNTAVVKNSREEFIKLKDGVYELTDANGGVSVYSKLAEVTDPAFFTFNISKPIISSELSASMFESTEKDFNIQNKLGVSSKEIKQIESNMSCQ